MEQSAVFVHNGFFFELSRLRCPLFFCHLFPLPSMKWTKRKPPRPVPAAPMPPGACERCKKRKKRCVYPHGSLVCEGCKSSNLEHACVPAGPNRHPSPAPHKSTSTRPLRSSRQAEQSATLESELEEDSERKIDFLTLGILFL